MPRRDANQQSNQGLCHNGSTRTFFMENPISTATLQGSASSPDDQAATNNESSFADILSEFEQQHHGPKPGQAIPGNVVSITADEVFVDIGRKIDGVIPVDQLRDEKGELLVKVGDKLLVTIAGSDGEGSYRLSTVKVERPKDWSALERAFAEQRAIAGTVTEVVKGGVRVDVGTEAFMPASRTGTRDAAEMEKLVGQEIQCKIIKLDTADEDVVVDRRSVLEEEEKLARQKRFAELTEGAVVRGTVRSVTNFGAFVDLGGIDGLLHVTDMAWQRVAKPADLVSPGDSVEVKILKIQPDSKRISLGMKQLTPDPWTLAVERFKVGDKVRGRVSRLTDFGAFVELLPGVEGLIHISEMSWSKKIKRPDDVLKANEEVEVQVLGVNPADHRISLGLKQALGDPWEDAAKKYAPGTVVEGPVTSLANFGCFIDLGNGIEGMIHISDITREKRLSHPKEALSMGQTVKAVVTELDRERRRIKLSIKQMEPTSIDEYIVEHKAGETVTGRIVEASQGQAKVELGEGVFGHCALAEESAQPAVAAPPAADLSALTAMLSAKWKQGVSSSATARPEPPKTGQVRSFRIVKLDQANKRIDVELAG